MKVGRLILVLPLVWSGVLIAQTVPVKEQLLSKITSMHTAIYAGENYFVSPFPTAKDGTSTSKTWTAGLDEVFAYILKNNTDKETEKIVADLKSASKSLLGVREVCYEKFVKPALLTKYQKDGLKGVEREKIKFSEIKFLDIDSIMIFLPKLHKTLTDMEAKVHADIIKIKDSTFTKKEKREALEVAERLDITLDSILGKYQRDLVALRAARDGKS